MSAPEVRTPADLPDLRLWLAEQWAPGRPFHRFAAPSQAARVRFQDRSLVNPDSYAQWERTMARKAALWWVSEEMVDLLLATARGVPDDVTYADLSPPSPAGLVVFAKPWWGIDAEIPDHQVQVDALLWGGATLAPLGRPQDRPGEGVPCLSASLYRRVRFEDGMTGDEMQLALATGALSHAAYHPQPPPTIDGRPATAADQVPMTDPEDRVVGLAGAADDGSIPLNYLLTGSTWVPLGRSDWPMVDPINEAPWPMPEQGRVSYTEDRKVLAALWTLVAQEGIASRTVQPAARPAMRRTERAGVPRELSAVQVVTLRRPRSAPSEDSEPGPARREWDHRTLVEGFWRWQACGPNWSERRLTFVRPHIRGPEGAPLRVRERVHAWVR